MTSILRITKSILPYGDHWYSLTGEVRDTYEAFDGQMKTDTFPVGEGSGSMERMEQSAKWYVDNFDNVIVKRQSVTVIEGY